MTVSPRRMSFAVLFVSSILGDSAHLATLFAEERPQLTRLSPAGAQIGQTVSMEAVGSFKSWPVQIWCNDPNVTGKCLEEAGKVQVTVSDSATASKAWIRFFNSAGTTTAKPILLSQKVPLLEKEPNNQKAEATPIGVAEEVHGVLEKNLDVDLFRFELIGGEPFSATIDSARMGSPLDAHLQLLDDRGFVVTENLDHFGLDPAIATIVPKSGTYFLKVFGFPIEPDSTISFRGGADWCYRLRSQRALLGWELPPQNVGEEKLLALVDGPVSESISDAVPLEASAPRIGVLSNKGKSHYFRLLALHGKTVEVRVVAQSMGSRMDPTLTILDKDGKQQSFLDDLQTNRDPKVIWQMPEQGDFFVAVTDFHKQSSIDHVYMITLEEVTPRGKLSLSNDDLQTKANQPLEIKLAIERLANWEGDVELFIQDGLTDSATCEPTKLKIDKSTTSATIKLTVTKPFQGPLPIRIRHPHLEAISELSGPTPAGVWLSVTE